MCCKWRYAVFWICHTYEFDLTELQCGPKVHKNVKKKNIVTWSWNIDISEFNFIYIMLETSFFKSCIKLTRNKMKKKNFSFGCHCMFMGICTCIYFPVPPLLASHVWLFLPTFSASSAGHWTVNMQNTQVKSQQKNWCQLFFHSIKKQQLSKECGETLQLCRVLASNGWGIFCCSASHINIYFKNLSANFVPPSIIEQYSSHLLPYVRSQLYQ